MCSPPIPTTTPPVPVTPQESSTLDTNTVIDMELMELQYSSVFKKVDNDVFKSDNIYQLIMEECRRKAPTFLHRHLDMCYPGGTTEADTPAIANHIGIMMNMRSRICRSVQKQNTLFLARAGAGSHVSFKYFNLFVIVMLLFIDKTCCCCCC